MDVVPIATARHLNSRLHPKHPATPKAQLTRTVQKCMCEEGGRQAGGYRICGTQSLVALTSVYHPLIASLTRRSLFSSAINIDSTSLSSDDFYGIRTPTFVPYEPSLLGMGGGLAYTDFHQAFSPVAVAAEAMLTCEPSQALKPVTECSASEYIYG